MDTRTGIERLTRMEVEVSELKKSFEEHKAETKENFAELNKKLDDVLALRNKGAGIFWFVSMLFSAGAVGAFLHYIGLK